MCCTLITIKDNIIYQSLRQQTVVNHKQRKTKKARCEILSTSITTELAEHPYPGKLQIQRNCCFIQLMPLTDNFSKKMRCTCFYQYLNNYCIVSILVNPPSSSDRDRVHILICFKPGVGMTFRIKLSQIIT